MRFTYIVLAALFVSLLAISPVRAAYPGQNGVIIFDSDRDGDREIYTMNPDGTNVTKVTNNSVYDSEPTLSPDGTKIAFRSDRDGNREIYTANIDGTNEIRLTNNSARDMYPAWSPDGTKLLFTSDRNKGVAEYDLYIMDANGANVTRLTTTVGVGGASQGQFSPGGDKVVYNGIYGGANVIYSINVNGTNNQQLTSDIGYHPDWSPDGTKIVYCNAQGGNNEIYTMNADGTNQVNISNDAGADNHPIWSPDGTKILWDSNRSGNREVYTMSINGSNVVNLSNTTAQEEYPRWRAIPNQAIPPSNLADSGNSNVPATTLPEVGASLVGLLQNKVSLLIMGGFSLLLGCIAYRQAKQP